MNIYLNKILILNLTLTIYNCDIFIKNITTVSAKSAKKYLRGTLNIIARKYKYSRAAALISNTIKSCGTTVKNFIYMISQKRYLSWSLIPGCNTFTATVCNFLAHGLADTNSLLPSRVLSAMIDY